MKESKFIELLNLYIDQQISPPETALLEQEILHDAKRRRVYRQYCQMHRACSVVLENFRTPAEAADAGELVDFETKPRRFAWGYYAAGLAAAACVAFVAMQTFVRTVPATAKGVIAAAPASATLAKVVPVRMDATDSARYGRQTTDFVAQRLVLFSPTGQQNPASLVIVADRDPLRPLSAAKTAPRSQRPSIEQFVFEHPADANANPPALRIRQTPDGQEEMAAYQFQR